MNVDKVGLNVSISNDCSECCPRKSIIRFCCCDAESDSDDEDHKIKRIASNRMDYGSTPKVLLIESPEHKK